MQPVALDTRLGVKNVQGSSKTCFSPRPVRRTHVPNVVASLVGTQADAGAAPLSASDAVVATRLALTQATRSNNVASPESSSGNPQTAAGPKCAMDIVAGPVAPQATSTSTATMAEGAGGSANSNDDSTSNSARVNPVGATANLEAARPAQLAAPTASSAQATETAAHACTWERVESSSLDRMDGTACASCSINHVAGVRFYSGRGVL